MSQITRLHTNQRMSKTVIHNNTVYLCGQVGERNTTVKEQTIEALARVERLLNEAGSDKDHILQTIVWLSDMADFAEMNEVWDGWFNPGMQPARACGEAKLAHPSLKVELIVTAALK
jgi:enamine deaminase RidA (YjgF/YER057c/UK114 family)